jgi:hypothetical protein
VKARDLPLLAVAGECLEVERDTRIESDPWVVIDVDGRIDVIVPGEQLGKRLNKREAQCLVASLLEALK